jgi:putative transposase
MSIGRKAPIHTLRTENLSRPIIVFLTVCVDKKRHLLANEKAHDLFLTAWRKFPAWQVGRYVIMPDHLHLFCSPIVLNEPLKKWVAGWKSYVACRWDDPTQSPIWQKNFWDTQLRSDESYDEKWNYVRQNPVRYGLVKRVEDWPLQGETNVLPW